MAIAQLDPQIPTGVPARCTHCAALVYLRRREPVVINWGNRDGEGANTIERDGFRWCDANGTAHECAA